ncbi:MAG: peptidoglycan-associated lipoprotein Pal [bacterium]
MRVLLVFVLALSLLAFFGCSKKATKVEEPSKPAVETQPEKVKPEREEKETEPIEPKEAIKLERIHFDFDRYNLRPDAIQVLTRNAEVLLAHPEIRIVIEGHCDERGTDEYNLALGERRAAAARDFLVRFGIDMSRISTVSYGEERPLDPRSNEEAWAKNRRAEFVIK